MEIAEIETILKRVIGGDSSARVDEKKVEPELRSFAALVNQAIDRLREGDEMKKRVDAMIRQNPLAIAVLRKDKSRIDINKQYEVVWRGSREELMKKKLYDFNIKVLNNVDFYQCFDTKKLAHTEAMVTFPDGVIRFLNLDAIPILDENGEIDIAFYVWTDVTELHTKMDEVKHMLRRTVNMVKYNPLAIAVHKKDKTLLDINKEYEKMWRSTREELMKKKIAGLTFSLLSGDEMFTCFDKKKRSHSEFLVRWADGIEKYLILDAIPILDEKGEIDVAFYIWSDVTDQHNKMAEIKHMMQRTVNMVKYNPLAIGVHKANKSLLDINKQYEKVWRGSREDLLKGKAAGMTLKVTSGDELFAPFEHRKGSHSEITVSWSDGTVKYLLLDTIPILDEKGAIDVVFYVWNDITEERKLKEQLDKSMKELADSLDTISKGDLTKTAQTYAGDPLEKVKNDLNAAVNAIRALLSEVDKSVKQMEQTTHETSKSTAEITKSTEQVAVSTQKSSEAAKKQLDEVENISKEISDLSASIEEIASTTQDVLSHAQKAAKEGNEAADLGKVATSKMHTVEKISQESVDEITRLNEQMREISNIVKLIADISNQTNLLALNAAIEAARAGEHGRGFAVVAGEVRNLAGESKNATNHIEGLIGSIQANSDKTAAAIRTSHNEIRAGIESVGKTIDALNRIIAESNVVAQGVNEITKATTDQADATNRVMQGVEVSSRMTRENLDRIEDMAAMAEETSASTEEIASASHELSAMAERLKILIEQFKLR
jgi:methyl-accepting chemotaxis protein